jgi:hypothetical protein
MSNKQLIALIISAFIMLSVFDRYEVVSTSTQEQSSALIIDKLTGKKYAALKDIYIEMEEVKR